MTDDHLDRRRRCPTPPPPAHCPHSCPTSRPRTPPAVSRRTAPALLSAAATVLRLGPAYSLEPPRRGRPCCQRAGVARAPLEQERECLLSSYATLRAQALGAVTAAVEPPSRSHLRFWRQRPEIAAARAFELSVRPLPCLRCTSLTAARPALGRPPRPPFLSSQIPTWPGHLPCPSLRPCTVTEPVTAATPDTRFWRQRRVRRRGRPSRHRRRRARVALPVRRHRPSAARKKTTEAERRGAPRSL